MLHVLVENGKASSFVHSAALIHWSAGSCTSYICQSFYLRTEDSVKHRAELALYERLIPGEVALCLRAAVDYNLSSAKSEVSKHKVTFCLLAFLYLGFLR